MAKPKFTLSAPHKIITQRGNGMKNKAVIEKLKEAYDFFEPLSYTIETALSDDELDQLDPNLNKILWAIRELEGTNK